MKRRHPIDKAVNAFLRSLDRIDTREGDDQTTARCNALRQAIALVETPHGTAFSSKGIGKSLGMLQLEELEHLPVQ